MYSIISIKAIMKSQDFEIVVTNKDAKTEFLLIKMIIYIYWRSSCFKKKCLYWFNFSVK